MKCEFCSWAFLPDRIDEEEFGLRCTNPLNNHSRNINSQSGRPYMLKMFQSFEVEKDNYCGAYDANSKEMV